MGPSVKFVLAIIDSISKKKMGVNFFSRKIGHEGGGVRGLRVCRRKNYLSSFFNISLMCIHPDGPSIHLEISLEHVL